MSARRSAARLALALGSLALFAGAAELGARALYDAPWHQRLVSEQARNEELEYERNAIGLRGPLYDTPKAPDARRILMIGDSFTFGMGVPRDEDIFLRRCERGLSATLDLPGVARVEIMNGSIIGSYTTHWRQVWDTAAPIFDPDVLVLVFFLRDGTLAGSIPEFFNVIRREVAERNAASGLYRNCYLYRHWRDGRDAAAIRSSYTRAFRDGYFGDEQATAEWRVAQENLRAMLDGARARGCATGFVIFPVLAGLREASYPFQDIVDLLDEYAAGIGFEIFDLTPTFLGRDGAGLWVSPLDQHPNEAAHELVAGALEPFLERLLREHEGL